MFDWVRNTPLSIIIAVIVIINPFSISVPFLYPLKASENRRFSDFLRGYRSGILVEIGLILGIKVEEVNGVREPMITFHRASKTFLSY